jgi:hypothetical protein
MNKEKYFFKKQSMKCLKILYKTGKMPLPILKSFLTPLLTLAQFYNIGAII